MALTNHGNEVGGIVAAGDSTVAYSIAVVARTELDDCTARAGIVAEERIELEVDDNPVNILDGMPGNSCYPVGYRPLAR